MRNARPLASSSAEHLGRDAEGEPFPSYERCEGPIKALIPNTPALKGLSRFLHIVVLRLLMRFLSLPLARSSSTVAVERRPSATLNPLEPNFNKREMIRPPLWGMGKALSLNRAHAEDLTVTEVRVSQSRHALAFLPRREGAPHRSAALAHVCSTSSPNPQWRNCDQRQVIQLCFPPTHGSESQVIGAAVGAPPAGRSPPQGRHWLRWCE